MKNIAESSNLDLLRSYAILLVLIDHVLETCGVIYDKNFHPFDWYCGRMGVLLFFVHTSLVLMFSMQRSNLSGLNLFRNFYIRRAFRIYPLSILCVLLVWISGAPSEPWTNESTIWDIKILTANLFLIQNLLSTPAIPCPLWSLPVEVQMYIMLPVLYIFFNNKPPLKLSLLILIASTFAASVQPHITSRASVVQFIPCFLGGVFSFNLFSKSIPKKSSWILFPVFLLAVSLLYLGVEFINPNTHHPQWLGWVLCLGTGIALPYFANIPQNGFASLCKIIARYSYGIYLFHIIALWFAFSVCKDFSQFLQWTIFLTICCFFPVLTYHLIEKPLIQMGNQIALKFNN